MISHIRDILIGKLDFHLERNNLEGAIAAVKQAFADQEEEKKRPSESIFDHTNCNHFETHLGIQTLAECQRFTYEQLASVPQVSARRMMKLMRALETFGYKLRPSTITN